MRLLILYATRRQSTAEVARYLEGIFKEYGIDVTTVNAETLEGDISQYDAYLLGTSIYSGMWLQPLIEKIRRHTPQIGDKPVWAWAMCIRVLEEGGVEHAHANYVPDRILNKLNMQGIRFFAGKLFIEDVDFEDRWTLSVRYDGTELPTQYNDDYRDWDAISAWGHGIAKQLMGQTQPE